MKPHLYLKWGVWCCVSANGTLRMGYGYSPCEAFEDWKQQGGT